MARFIACRLIGQSTGRQPIAGRQSDVSSGSSQWPSPNPAAGPLAPDEPVTSRGPQRALPADSGAAQRPRQETQLKKLGFFFSIRLISINMRGRQQQQQQQQQKMMSEKMKDNDGGAACNFHRERQFC